MGIVPVRCFSCGALIGDKWEELKKRVEAGESAARALDAIGVRKYCCRAALLSHVDILDEALKYHLPKEKEPPSP